MNELISKEALRIAVLDTDWNDDTDEDVALDMIDNAPIQKWWRKLKGKTQAKIINFLNWIKKKV